MTRKDSANPTIPPNSGKPTITETQAEKIADARIKARLAHDPAYRFAENAHEQAAAEDQVEETVWAEIEREYEIQ